MNRSKAKTDVKRWGFALVASFTIALLIEICIFNYQSLETAFLPPNSASIGKQSADEVTIYFSNSNAETIPVDGEIATLTFTTDSDIPISLDIAAKDEGNQLFYSLGNTTINGSKTIRINSSWIPLILTFIALASHKRGVSLAALAPMYASMAVLFISPIVMCRYALPVFALIPLALAIALSGTKQGEIPR